MKTVCYLLLLLSFFSYGHSFNELARQLAAIEDKQDKLLLLKSAEVKVPSYNIEDQAEYFFEVGKIHLSIAELNLSLTSFTRGIELLTLNDIPVSTLLADLYSYRAASKKEITQDPNEYCNDKKLSLFVERKLVNNQARVAEALSDYAPCLYHKNTDISAAIALLNEAIKIGQEHQLTLEQEATIYNRAASLYRKVNLHEQAYKYNKLAYQKWKQDNNKAGIVYMLSNMASNAIYSENYALAQQHLNEKYQFIAENPEVKKALLNTHYLSGKLAYMQKNWQQSIYFLSLAIEERRNSDEIPYIQASYELLSIAQFRAGQVQDSFSTLDSLKEIFPNSPPFKKEVTAILALKNSKSTQVSNAALNEAFTLLDTERKARREFIKQSTAQAAKLTENNLKQLENFSLKQRFFYAAIITFIVITSLLIYTYFQHQKRNIATKEKQLTEKLLNQKNQLLADVSHELGTPLTVLKLQVESLKDDLEEDVQASYDALDNKLTDIEHLIDDIHQLAQSDVGALPLNLEPFDLNSTLALWEKELTQFVSNNKLTFHIRKHLPDGLEVNYDRDKIKQIIINLLSNCIKYTDKPGKVNIVATIKAKHFYLSIEDSAPAVPDKDLTAIFERLYRIENSRSRETGGSGLGLAICKSLITAHNGTIHAEQSSFGGLKIVISLPLKPSA